MERGRVAARPLPGRALENGLGDVVSFLAERIGVEWFASLGVSVGLDTGQIFVACVLLFHHGIVGELAAAVEGARRKRNAAQSWEVIVVDETLVVNTNGIRMHLSSAGQGPTILLLHGFPDTHAVWRKQLPVLAGAGFRVLAPDLRGYGRSDAPPRVFDYTLEKLRADVLGLLDRLEVGKVHLVGHDWGAVLGWQLAALAPTRVERLVSLSSGHPSAIFHAGLFQHLRLAYVPLFCMPGIAEQMLRAGDWFLLRQFTSEPGQAELWKRELGAPGRLSAALNYYRANLKLALPQSLPRVKIPVMGIWSDRDPALGEKQMRDSAHYVDGEFRFERLRDADHWPQLTAADRMNALLLDFLATRKPQASFQG